MLRITRAEQTPFHTLPHRTSGLKGGPIRNWLPFYRAYAIGLPVGMEAIVLTSDLQRRENGGQNRLLVDPEALPGNVRVLDGQIAKLGGLKIGGVSGIVGNPQRNQRRTEGDFLAVMESVTDKNPDLLLLHRGPDDPDRGRLGDPGIALSLTTGFEGLTVFGHTRWDWPWLMPMGTGQVLNVDARVVVVLRAESE